LNLSELGRSNNPNNQDEIVDDFGRFSLHLFFVSRLLRLFEVALVLVHPDHITSVIVNTDNGVM